jgi:putative inorganic carbon (hco3(-)) transporter
MLLFRPQDFPGPTGELFASSQLMAILLVFAAVGCILDKKPLKLAAPVYLTPLILISFGISTALTGWLGGAVAVFNKHWILIVQVIVTSLAIQKAQHLRYIFVLFCSMSVIFTIHGLQQIETGIGFSGVTILEYSTGPRIRYTGMLRDPNDLGLFFLITLPMFYFLFTNSKSYVFKLILLLSTAFVFLGIYYTNSRGTIVGLGGLLAVIVVLRRNFIAMGAGAIAVVLLLIFGPSRVSEIDVDEASAWERVEAWYEGIQALKENPLFGVGLNGFTDRFTLVAHNSFVQVFAELGFVGYCLWLAAIYTSFRYVFRVAIIRKQDLHLDVAGTLSLSMIAFMFATFFITRSFEPLFFVMLGLCSSIYQFMPQLIERAELKASTIAIHVVVLCAGSIFLFMVLGRVLRLFR